MVWVFFLPVSLFVFFTHVDPPAGQSCLHGFMRDEQQCSYDIKQPGYDFLYGSCVTHM